MKRTPEYIEGPEEFTRFQETMKRVVTISHAEIQHRIEAERQRAALNLTGAARSGRSSIVKGVPQSGDFRSCTRESIE